MEDDSSLSYERILYAFDSGIVENGFIEFTKTRTLLQFPALPQTLSTVPRELSIYLNNVLILNFKWLPFFSAYDYYRIMDMFAKCLYQLSYYYAPSSFTSSYPVFDKVITNMNIKNYSIYTLQENQGATSIQITRHPTSPALTDQVSPDHIFQIRIGHSTILCTERDLVGLDQDESLFLIGYILQKITDI